ncbi:hypothetical protein DMB42_34455 [Nonomuraea sp. WAC 01424]|uniref:hypothetical protein n=1 Tax=Nonomuraea sp. WAC 01424 TaxID=2203200 RepID=UPI000F7677E6|nr:hypothetical protein [Nonomuraea sp. WAC 01424]RSN02950.1 hypothetical protein DMB42_34455 [Nonomuraea sp. WAC 01424]
MADQVVLDELQQALDEAFQGRDRVAMREVYARVSAHLRIPADMLAHLNEVPEGRYTREEMAEAINGVIRRRGEQDSLGLLRIPRQRPVEVTPAAERAVEDDTPLEYLNPTGTRPDDDDQTPRFREPGA